MTGTWFEWQDAPPADYAVIGDPVAHSLSPRMHQAGYTELGLSFRYVAIRVPERDLSEALEHLTRLGYAGVNVTVPLKEAAFTWCQGGDPRMSSVNTLRFEDKSGTNTDAPGFLRTLADLGVEPCRALVLGAGGSARALCVALSDAGYSISVWNRTKKRAQDMLISARCVADVVDTPDVSHQDLVINATSSGLSGESLEIDWAAAPSSALAYDLFYSDGATAFLSAASTHGLRTVDGRPLLVAQGALSFEWWTGRTAPRTAMMQAVT